MAIRRADGSVLSENTPSGEFETKTTFYGVHKVILTSIQYSDESKNIFKKTQTPEVSYSGVVIGGKSEGQDLSNIRDSRHLAGEAENYSEQIYKVCSKPLTGSNSAPLNKQDGAIVYVTFIDGDPSFPIIIGAAKGALDTSTTGSTKSNGPIKRWQYNGMFFEIDKNGNLTFTRKGGSFDSVKNTFKADSSGKKVVVKITDQLINITTESGTEVDIDGTTGKISLKGSYVDLGKSVSDLVTQFTELASAFNTHTHPYDDNGTPNVTSPPSGPLPISVGSKSVKVQS